MEKNAYHRFKRLHYRASFSTKDVEHFCGLRFRTIGRGILGNCGCGNQQMGMKSVDLWNNYTNDKLTYTLPIIGGGFHIIDHENLYSDVVGSVDREDISFLKGLIANIVVPIFSPITNLDKLYKITVDTGPSPIGLRHNINFPIGVRAIHALLQARHLGIAFEKAVEDLKPLR